MTTDKRKALEEQLKELELRENEIIAKMVDYKTTNRIEFFTRHNPMQAKLLKAWQDQTLKVFTFTGGNRIGKCATASTHIDTPSGPMPLGSLYAAGAPFDVFAWDGKKRVVAKALPPFKKEDLHQCYRLHMSDGTTLDLADEHQLLTSHGWIYVERLAKFFPILQGSSLGPDLSIRPSGARHSTQTASNYPDDCLVDHDLSGGQPHLEEDTDRAFSPLRDGVRLLGSFLCGLDDWARKSSSTLLRVSGLPSIRDALRRFWDRCVGFLCHCVYKFWRRADLSNLFVPRPIYASFPQFQPTGVFGLSATYGQSGPYADLYRDPGSNVVSWIRSSLSVSRSRQVFSLRSLPIDELDSPYFTPFKIIGENSIKYITKIPTRQEVYDFTVLGYHNYFAGGMVHHNTTIGAVLAICTLAGEYLWKGEKMWFPHHKPRKVRYIGQDWEKQIKAVVLPELEKWWPAKRPVKKKKNNAGVDAIWTDIKTGSVLEIMSNGQEAELHEGWNGDLIIYDEPPTRPIRVANARGLVDNQGRELFCMTLLKEAWVDREVIKAVDRDGRPDRSVFNVHGEIYDNVGYGITEAGVEQFAKTLTEDEKDARLRGIPSYMSGLVYPKYTRRDHLIERFQVPLSWLIDIAIDVHPREKQAVLFCAVAPNGNKYLVNEVWGHGDGTWVGEQVVRCCKLNNYRVNRVIVDPLSKGDKNNPSTVFDKIANVLWKHELLLETASKDKTSGIILVKDHLMGPNNQPSLFIFDDLVRTIFEIEGYMWDKETQNPMDKDDHMMENLYRLMLLDTSWYEDEEEDDTANETVTGRSAVGGY